MNHQGIQNRTLSRRGVDPEVTDEAVRVLAAAAKQAGNFVFRFTSFPWGANYCAEHGRVMAGDFLEVLRPFDAMILGAVGWRKLAPGDGVRRRFNEKDGGHLYLFGVR